MSMIPQLPHCRFITIKEINQKSLEDNFTYKSFRVAGKVKTYFADQYLVELEDIFNDQEDQTLLVNIFALKSKIIEAGKVYEFMGEIEPNTAAASGIILVARIIKMDAGFHKFVYQETTSTVNQLIEAITTRNQTFKKKTAEEAAVA